jgi:hypothetical protein
MVVSPSEDNLYLACKNNNIVKIDIKSIGLNEDHVPVVSHEKLCKGFHSGAVTSIDVAI